MTAANVVKNIYSKCTKAKNMKEQGDFLTYRKWMTKSLLPTYSEDYTDKTSCQYG